MTNRANGSVVLDGVLGYYEFVSVSAIVKSKRDHFLHKRQTFLTVSYLQFRDFSVYLYLRNDDSKIFSGHVKMKPVSK